MPTVLLIGTLDTKGQEYAYVRDQIRAAGHDTIVMDLGILGEPVFAADISAAEVARAGGGDLDTLRTRGDRGAAIEVMQRGAYEAIYEGTPVIVSRSPVLEREFTAGAILVENTVASVTDAIRRMQADGDRYRRGAQELRRFKQQRWQQTKQVLLSKLGRGHRVASSGVPVPAAAITDSGSDRRTP